MDNQDIDEHLLILAMRTIIRITIVAAGIFTLWKMDNQDIDEHLLILENNRKNRHHWDIRILKKDEHLLILEMRTILRIAIVAAETFTLWKMDNQD